MKHLVQASLFLWLAAALATPQAQFVPVGPSAADRPEPLLRAMLGNVPIHIIENRGVHSEVVRYYVAGTEKSVFFTDDGVTFALRGNDRDWAVKLEFVDASPDVRPRGMNRRRAVFSYFSGPRENWKTGLPSFGGVIYENLWPGIDLIYRAAAQRLKYEFVVKPGADPRRIRLRYHGATAVRRTENGALWVVTPVAQFEDAPPKAWVRAGNDTRSPVGASYVVDRPSGGTEPTVCFAVAEYARDRTLVIDPAVLVYCGFLGGNGKDAAHGVDVDSSGCAYLAGYTSPSPTFPVKVGPITTIPKLPDAGFVAKVDASGKGLVYCGMIAGGYWGSDTISDVAVDSAGCAYVIGSTMNNEKTFPVTVGPDLTHNGRTDCFVAKVNAAGIALEYCGYVGGYHGERAFGIAVDNLGCAYILGDTGSADVSHKPPGTPFPTTVGPDTTFNGGGDVFVAKVNAKGTGLVYCGYIGGAAGDEARGITADANGCAYVVGRTGSSEKTFPVKVGPRQTMWPGTVDGFVAKVKSDGTGLDYCGYFGGGSPFEDLYAIAVDGSGHAYVAGATGAPESNLPLKVGPFLKRKGTATDALVAKIAANGKSVVYCGLIGGTMGDTAMAIAVDGQGNAHVAGTTASTEQQNFPVKRGPQLVAPGIVEGWVAMIDKSGRYLRYCSYLAGRFHEYVTAIATTRSGTAFVAGWTQSSQSNGFPVKIGPDLTYNMGANDAFVARLDFHDVQFSGSTQIGRTVAFTFTVTDSAGLPYQVGSSLGTGPITIGGRVVGLNLDDLLVVSVSDLWPTIFQRYRGVIDATGQAQAAIRLPNQQALIGVRICTALVTLDPKAPHGIRTITGTKMFTVTK